MANNHLLWQLAYQLSGLTLLDQTPLEPLGTLPVPVRTAILEVAHSVDPEEIHLRQAEKTLLRTGDPRRATYRWVEWWDVAHNEIKETLQRIHPDDLSLYSSLDEFIHRHHLEKPNDSSLDEHYAERLFLEHAFIPVFGITGLSYLHPQYCFEDASERQRRIDFLLSGSKDYAIEIEGATYHDPARIGTQRFEEEKQRQRSISEEGFTYIPFTLLDIQQGRAKATLREISSTDPVLRLMQLIDPEMPQRKPTLQYLGALLARFPKRYPLYQKVALSILWKATDRKQKRIVVADLSPRLAILPVALMDTSALVERVAQLYGLEVDLPELCIYIVGDYDRIGVHEVLKRYLGADPGEDDRRVDAGKTPVSIHFREDLPETDYLFAGEAAERPLMKDCIWGRNLDLFPKPFERMVGDEPPEALPGVKDHEVLDYFTRRYFLVPELKERQYELLAKVLNRESVLGILPTGYGKSLVFQLFSIIVPRTTLVVSPLRSLILDQIQNLRRLGLKCAESVISLDNPSERDQKYRDLQAQRYRLFYISPERLRLKDFHNQIQATLKSTSIGALVIDEAHCVSEWGHDFRPAYLQIDRFRKTIETASGHKVPIIALTATASSEVRKDILKVLGLDESAIVQQESSDRPNLSLSVWEVDPRNRDAKSEMLMRLVAEEIPSALDISLDELVPMDGRPPFDHAGVIFGIYAAPNGRSTAPEGVHFIAHELVSRLTKDEQLVRVHASKPPWICPYCGSTRLVKASDKELWQEGIVPKGIGPPEAYFKCLGCSRTLRKVEVKKDPHWESKLLKHQDEFHKDQYPLLVATKGYGMGIDKRNIRFIVHHAFASGLEGYYQEAGRAGRDGKHAHVALMYIPPDPKCEDEHLRDKSPPKPPCASGRWRCKYGLPVVCDYGKQARFIEQSYEGIEKDLKRIMEIYRLLEKGEKIRSKGQSKADEEEKTHKVTELALYRLQQLGVIEGYTMAYSSGIVEAIFEPEYRRNWIPEEVVDSLTGFLSRYNAGQEYIKIARARLQEILAENQGNDVHNEIFISEASNIMLDHIYKTIPNMRYQMLENERTYAKSRECRRIILRSIFDNVDRLILDKYRCNFCDVCVPDLKFSVTQAEVPSYEAELDEKARRLPELLEGFDFKALNDVAQAAVNKQAVTGFLARITFFLEQRYNNTAALYLAGVLSRHRGENQEALRYLKDGFKFGVQLGFPPEDLVAFYKEAVHIDRKEAFSWLLEEGGPWDSIEGLEFLLKEAHHHFGNKNSKYRHLMVLWKVRMYRENIKDCGAILNKAHCLRALKERVWPV